MLKLKITPILALCILALALLLALPAAAQSTANSASAPQANTEDQNGSQDQSMETLKVNVEVVQLFFNVKDKHGALIPNLTKNDFDIFEDGKPQTIKYFKAESDLPLTLGIMIDSIFGICAMRIES